MEVKANKMEVDDQEITVMGLLRGLDSLSREFEKFNDFGKSRIDLYRKGRQEPEPEEKKLTEELLPPKPLLEQAEICLQKLQLEVERSHELMHMFAKIIG